MKKYIMGFLIGAIFTLSTTVFADDIESLIGKEVEGESTVIINDQTLTTIIVEGKNYAPVRSIGEAAGYTVTVEGKQVILEAGDNVNTAEVKEKYRLQRIENLKTALENANKQVTEVTTLINNLKDKSSTAVTEASKKNYATAISEQEQKLIQCQQSVKDIEANLAALEQ